MYCIKCQDDIATCVCPDIKERLQELAAHPSWTLTMCSTCGDHITRCTCPKAEA